MKMRVTLFLLIFWLAFPAFAETAADARKELSSTMAEIKASDKRQKDLAKKTEKLQGELKALQEKMAETGEDTSRQEEDLSANEETLGSFERRKKEKTDALEARQTEFAAMISAMIKLKQLPPEAVIAMPGKLNETLETARALGIITKAIEDESQSLKVELRELDALEDKIRHSRQAIASRTSSLADRKAELAAQMKERSALVSSLGGQENEERARIAHLTAKSKTLQELVDSLQKSEYGWMPGKAEADASPIQKHERPSNHAMRSFEKAEGHIRMPAAAKIVSRFGNTGLGETFSKGLVLETREDASVVAPFDGEVVYAGEFRDYGRIVIIRHSDGYHTMLSGMDEIDCKPGQFLLEGEPIGSMGGSNETRLYMELREDGKPVDPSGWLGKS